VNAPYALAMMMRLAGIVTLLPISVVAGEAAGRDVMTRMTPLVYTAPVAKATHLGGRFAAALLLAAVVSLAVPGGTLVAVVVSGAAPDVLGPLRPASYASAWLATVLPNVVVATSLAFAMATLARRPMAGWVAGALLLTASMLCWCSSGARSASGRSPRCSIRWASRRSRRRARRGPRTRSEPRCPGSRRATCGTARSGSAWPGPCSR
jgi:hypothetical protein